MAKEVVYTKSRGFEVQKIAEMPEKLEAGMVLVKPLSVGICGSDLKFIENLKDDAEIYLGHEWVGEVLKVGSGSRFSPGDMVTSGAIIGCGECEQCKAGKTNFCLNGMFIGSEDKGMLRSWSLIPDRALLKLEKNKEPGALSLLEVASVGDEAIRLLQQMSTKKGKLLILGAGPVGVFTALRAKREGYDFDLIEIEPYRIKKAQELDLPVKSLGEFLFDKSNYNKFDLIVDCAGDGAGKPGLWKYFNLFVTYNTQIVVVAKYSQKIEMDPRFAGDLSIGIRFMRGLPQETFEKAVIDWQDEIEDLAKVIISDRYELEEANEAFERAKTKSKGMKIILDVKDS